MSMSSINLSHENGFRITDCRSCLSSLPINMLAYDVPIFYTEVTLKILSRVERKVSNEEKT